MPDERWYQREAARTLDRLLPHLNDNIDALSDAELFRERLDAHFAGVFRYLHLVYGDRYDLIYHIERILKTLIEHFAQRPLELRALDALREQDAAPPRWYQRSDMIGAVFYVDLFAGNLAGVRKRIPYLKELSVSYLHLMPLFRAPDDNSDGGYAVSDYRHVNPALGTMAQLADLAAELRANGISLCLDFVFNHTSDEHEWAVRAAAGEAPYDEFYHFFESEEQTREWGAHLREIFPETSPGSFTQLENGDWVWTTFNSFQWDLNYRNPAVFNAMLDEMLFLANQGVEVLRLDAVAFVWKQIGTTSENLDQAHWIIRAYNALVRIVAPAMVFKSEAIVHPDEVARYISVDECQLSYNPTFMALIWEALATREVRLLQNSMAKRFGLPEGTAWVNYVRVHDDIGWSFANEDAAALGMWGDNHRRFLNDFYSGTFGGTFAKGLGFNYNPDNGDMRIAGTAASLAGLERAIEENNERNIEHSLRRIIMIHSLIIAAGGIPLLYLGDEIATMNDYSYVDNPDKANDERWVHRPRFDWQRARKRTNTDSSEGRVFQAIQRMIDIRKVQPAMSADKQTLFFGTQNPHVLGFMRHNDIVVLANFGDSPQSVRLDVLDAYWPLPRHIVDLWTGETITRAGGLISLGAYRFVWLARGE